MHGGREAARSASRKTQSNILLWRSEFNRSTVLVELKAPEVELESGLARRCCLKVMFICVCENNPKNTAVQSKGISHVFARSCSAKSNRAAYPYYRHGNKVHRSKGEFLVSGSGRGCIPRHLNGYGNVLLD